MFEIGGMLEIGGFILRPKIYTSQIRLIQIHIHNFLKASLIRQYDTGSERKKLRVIMLGVILEFRRM